MDLTRPTKRARQDDGMPAWSALSAILFGTSGPLPHARADCPKCVFRHSVDDASHWVNKNVCDLCFCLVCDRRVSDCPAWPVHCMAYFDSPLWRDLRTRTRNAVRVLQVSPSLVPLRVRMNKSVRRFLLDEEDPGAQASPRAANASNHRIALPSGSGAPAEEVINLDLEKGKSGKNGSCVHSGSSDTSPVSVDQTVSATGLNHRAQDAPVQTSPVARAALDIAPTAGRNADTSRRDRVSIGASPGPSTRQLPSSDENGKAFVQDMILEGDSSQSRLARRGFLKNSSLRNQEKNASTRPGLPSARPANLELRSAAPGSSVPAGIVKGIVDSVDNKQSNSREQSVVARISVQPLVTRDPGPLSNRRNEGPSVSRPQVVTSKEEPTLASLSVPSSSDRVVASAVPKRVTSLNLASDDGLEAGVHRRKALSLRSVPFASLPRTNNNGSNLPRKRSVAATLENLDTVESVSVRPILHRRNIVRAPRNRHRPSQSRLVGFSSKADRKSMPHGKVVLRSVALPSSPFRSELDILRSKWSVEQLFPSQDAKTKLARLQSTPRRPNSLPTRIFIGTIDLWRPYCSHMSAAKFNHSLGYSSKDILSFNRARDVQVSGMKNSHVEVLLREMGLDLPNPMLISSFRAQWLLAAEVVDDVPEWMLSRSSFACEDKSQMPSQVLHGLSECIERNDLEVQWELLHHNVSDNTDKAFAHSHSVMEWMEGWSDETLRRVSRQQLAWLNKRQEAIESLQKFNTSNCCVLRASVYVTPNALGSNMVTVAKAFVEGTPYSHMKPLDAPRSVVEEKGKANKNRYSWMETEMRVRTDHSGMNAVIAALKPVRSAQPMASSSELPNTSPRSPNGPSPFLSLCRTYKPELDKVIRDDANETIRHLKELTVERGMDSENKTSVDAILSSKRFIVSDGYSRAAEQPHGIGLPLRLYQKESLAWMIDQERKKSINEPFWTKISAKTVSGNHTDLYYSPLTGSLARYAPPPIVGGVLAEEMGLGKTLIMISLIVSTLDEALRLSSRRKAPNLKTSHATLIVCPVSLLTQWEQEFKTKVSRRLKVLLWYGQSRPHDVDKIASFDVVLTTYGILSQQRKSFDALTKINWYRLVIDESTYLRGGANTCSAVLSKELISARRWAVSGTPFGNNFKEFLGTLRFLGVVPFSSQKDFDRLSCVATNSTEQLSKISDFHLIPQLSYILKNLMIRHLKDQTFRGETLVKLPPATGRRVQVDLSTDERTLYDALESKAKVRSARFLRSAKSAGSNYIALRSMMIPLRVMADGVQPEIATSKSSGPTKTEDEIVDSALMKVRDRLSGKLNSAKIRRLLEDVRSYRAADPSAKFVVFTEFRSVKNEIQSTLKSHGLDVLTLDGNMTAGRRGKMIKMFAEDADVAVLVLSMRLGACGLTLTMANVVVLFEVGLDIATELQAVNRIHRIGQTRQVETLTYVAEGTIDERMTDVRKRRGQPRVVGESVEAGQKEELSTVDVYRTLFDYSAP